MNSHFKSWLHWFLLSILPAISCACVPIGFFSHPSTNPVDNMSKFFFERLCNKVPISLSSRSFTEFFFFSHFSRSGSLASIYNGGYDPFSFWIHFYSPLPISCLWKCVCVYVCACVCVYLCVCECMGSCSVAQFCLTLSTPWTVTNQAFLSMEWVTISYSRDLPNPGLELCLLHPLHWPEDSLALCHQNFPRKCNQTQKTFIFRNHYHCLSNSSLEHKEICVFLGLGKQNEPP